MKAVEVRTEKYKLLIGLFSKNDEGNYCLETKQGKRTDWISLDELMQLIKRFMNENSQNDKNCDLDELVCL